MVKLLQLPAQHIIDGFKGVIDFYVHDGVPCARKWPRSPGHKRAPRVRAQWAAFSYINQIAKLLPAEIIAAYKEMAVGSNAHWKDFLTQAYISGIEGIAELNPMPWIKPITQYFTITGIEQHQLPTGWKTIITTDVACTMLMFWTDRLPIKKFIYRRRRGVSILAMATFKFIYTRKLWQREDTNSFTHTFYFITMPEGQTRWFGTIAWKTRWLMKSTSPIMHKTRLHGYRWPIIVETWDNPYVLPPHMEYSINETWTPTEPPELALIIQELWHNPYQEPPPLISIFTEPWSLFTDPPPMTQIIIELWHNPFTNPPTFIKIITEEWTS